MRFFVRSGHNYTNFMQKRNLELFFLWDPSKFRVENGGNSDSVLDKMTVHFFVVASKL